MVSIMTCETVNNWIVTVIFPYFHITDTPFPQKYTHAKSPNGFNFDAFYSWYNDQLESLTSPPFFPGSFPSIWTFKDYFVEIPAPGQILCSNAPTNFLKR